MTRLLPTQALEDRLGKFAMLVIFGAMAAQSLSSLGMLIANRADIPLWGLALVSQMMGIGFLALILYFTLVRLPPRSSAAGLAPRIVAIAGTFIMSVLIIMPAEAVSVPVRALSSVLSILGAAASIWAIRQLGRSFSIMATSRALKTEGSYGIVRHPLYGAEVVMIVGMVIGHGTLAAYGIGVLWLVLQVRRAQYEELVLRDTFPEYADYARRVPMLIPGLHLSWLEEGLKLKATSS